MSSRSYAHTGHLILYRYLLGAQMLLDRDVHVGAALDRRVVRHDHARPSVDEPDPGEDAGAREFVLAIGRVCGEHRELHER